MHGVRLVTRPAPNRLTSARRGWWLSVSPRPVNMNASLYAPARAVLGPDEFRGNAGVGDLAGLAVDVEHLGRPEREVAEQHHLRQRPGVIGEVRAGGRAALARRDPFGVDPLRARILLRGRMRDEIGLAGFIEHPWVLAVDPRDQLAIVADPHLAARIERPRGRVRDLRGAGGEEAAVAPHDLDLGPLALGREPIRDARDGGCALAVQLGRFGLDPRRIAEVEGPERCVHGMARAVAQRAGAETPPPAPLERGVRRMIGPGRRGAEPQLPIEPGRRVVLVERPVERLRPDRPVGPELDLAHGADGAGFHPLADLAGPFLGEYPVSPSP